jgi:SMODS and SLOG-associating 2TM effector domain 1/Protein of unknown function (DUF4231)
MRRRARRLETEIQRLEHEAGDLLRYAEAKLRGTLGNHRHIAPPYTPCHYAGVDQGTAGAAAGVWSQQSVWSQAANRLRVGIGRARAIALVLTIAGAVLSTLATEATSLSTAAGKVLAVAAGAAVALAPIARTYLAPASVEDWTRARSVSEGLKSELYTYLAAGSPYQGEDRDAQLMARTGQVQTDAADLIRYATGLCPVDRPLPAVHDADSYLRVRLVPQWEWYTTRANGLKTRLTWVKRVQFGLSLLAAILGVLAATLAVTAPAAWIAVATTVSVAITAYAAGSRYEYQLVEYLRTAFQLDQLRKNWAAGHGTMTSDAFVHECEQVISVQNEGWMAKWIDRSAPDS